MFRPSLLVVTAIVAFVLAAPVALADPVPGVSGRWYTEGEEEGVFIQYLVDRKDDGTFSAQLRTPRECSSPRQGWVESGHWRFQDGKLIMRTEMVDGQSADPSDTSYESSFIVTVVDQDHATMFDEDTKLTWSMRRVGQDFSFPQYQNCAV